MKKLAVLALLAACGGGAADVKNPTDTKPSGAAITQFAKRDDALKVDKIGGADGQLGPDGHNDAAFDATIRGPAVGVLVFAESDNSWQWDTYVGIQDVPVQMRALVPKGSMTGGIGVFENGKPLNGPNGSFVLLDDKEHHVVVYISDNGAFQPGSAFKMLAETPDHKIIESPVAKF